MPARVIVTGLVLVLLVVFAMLCVQLFVPLSAKAEMNSSCRSALLKMELEGGMTDFVRENLQAKLTEAGFTNIEITATASAKYGQQLDLRVEAYYAYKMLGSLFNNAVISQQMVYRRASIARKVIN